MSKRLTEEAERYIEDFISNVEDTDISSFDGERSDASSSLGGVPTKRRDSTTCVIPENFESPVGSNANPIGTDGVVLPWLQWETSNDGSLMVKNKSKTPITPKSLQWDAEQVSCTIGFINNQILTLNCCIFVCVGYCLRSRSECILSEQSWKLDSRIDE